MQSTKLKEFDLNALPEEARKELMDFYEFLLKKYTIKDLKLPQGFYNPIKVNSYNIIAKRDEIYER